MSRRRTVAEDRLEHLDRLAAADLHGGEVVCRSCGVALEPTFFTARLREFWMVLVPTKLP